MTPAVIAIKYCGGCDPSFDRVAVFNEIKERLGKKIEWVLAGDYSDVPVLVMCGCATACADTNQLNGNRVIRISDSMDIHSVVAELENLVSVAKTDHSVF